MRPSRAPRPCLSVPALPGLLALAAALAAAVPAAATEARVRSLGGDGEYFEDLANVLRWYGSLPAYADLAVVELGTFDADRGDRASDRQASRQGAGAHLALGQEGRHGVVGAYLFDDRDRGDAPAARMLLYGRSWGGIRAALAFGVTKESLRERLGDAIRIRNSEDVVLGAGARWDLGAPAYMEIAGETIRSWREHLGPEFAGRLDDTGWGSFGLRARLFWEPGPGWILTPMIDYRRQDTWSLADVTRPLRVDAWSRRIGVGLARFPHPDVQVLASVEHRRAEDRWEALFDDGATPSYATNGEDAIHARLGLEARVRPWLTVRAGVRNAPGSFGRDSEDDPAGAGDFDLTLGLGAHLGELDFDLLLNDDAPFNFGSLLTNAGGEEDNTFTCASLSYAF